MDLSYQLYSSRADADLAGVLKHLAETGYKQVEGFGGVKRRFTITGQWNDITVVDDYGHHPVEITAVLRAARQRVQGTGGKIHAIHQPHRFSRLNDLFEDFCTCFNEADSVLIADVFAAGEAPIEGADALVLTVSRHTGRLCVGMLSYTFLVRGKLPPTPPLPASLPTR